MRTQRHFIFLILSFLMTTSYAVTPVVCSQAYALCTSAPCVPDPRHPEFAICSCVVEQGDSVGFNTCDKRAPKQDQFKTTQLISTFSFAQFKTKKSMTCKTGIPWTNCVDAPCTVNPIDPTKAICSCKIENHQAFFTFGGDCDVKQCANGFWSGATSSSDTLLRNALYKKLKIAPNLHSNSTCPINGADSHDNH